MPFTPEDGSVVSGANAQCSVAQVTDALDLTGGNADWTAASDSDREAAIVRATDYIGNQQRYRFRGTQRGTVPWPRTGAVEQDGPAIAEDVIPDRVVRAVAALAVRSLAGTVEVDQTSADQVVSKTIGPISTTYRPDAPTETVIAHVDGLLSPLLRSPPRDTRAVIVGPSGGSTPAAREFQSGAFSNRGNFFGGGARYDGC